MVQDVSSTSASPASAMSVRAEERKLTAPGANKAPRPADNDGRVGQVQQSNGQQQNTRANSPQTLRPGVQFNDDAARFVYLGINSSTQEVERQFPSERELRQLAFFRAAGGKLVDEDA